MARRHLLRSLALTFLSAALLCALLAPASYAFSLDDLTDKIEIPSLPGAAESEPPPPAADKPRPAPTYTGPRKRIGVMDMEVKITAAAVQEPTTSGGIVSTTTVSIPPPTDFGSGLTEMLTTALVETDRFIVLERAALADIQAEHQLGAAGELDPSSAPAVGKLLGAQALIRGAVTEYTYRRTSTGGSASFLQGIGVGASKAQAAVVLDIRLYDTTTGRILDSVKAEGRASASATALDVQREELQMSASGFAQSPLGAATREAIDRAVGFIVERMEEIPWEGRIAALDPEEGEPVTTIYLNAGADAGLRERDRFQILRPGRDIIDPETKLVIGRARDTLLGACRVESVTKTLALAVPLEGGGFRVGDVVRYLAPRPPARAQPGSS